MTSTPQSLASHPLSPAQERWLRECANAPDTPRQTLRVRLHRELPPDFEPEQIDPRLFTSGEITPLGLWRIDPNNMRLQAIDRTIREIQRRLDEEPPPTRVTAAEIAKATQMPEDTIGEGFRDLGSLGSFFSASAGMPNNPRGWSYINIAGPHGYDEYLRYQNLGELLERIYRSRGAGLAAALHYSEHHRNFSGTEPTTANPALSEERRNTAFVIMAMDPNNPEFADTYATIQMVCLEFGLQALRIDDIEHTETITERVLAEIEACPYTIADLTGERPNVYYEIGFAHGMKRSPILFRKAGTLLHFDLSVHKAPAYKNQTELSQMLRRRLEAIVPRPPSLG
jgi:hypothetical protein